MSLGPRRVGGGEAASVGGLSIRNSRPYCLSSAHDPQTPRASAGSCAQFSEGHARLLRREKQHQEGRDCCAASIVAQSASQAAREETELARCEGDISPDEGSRMTQAVDDTANIILRDALMEDRTVFLPRLHQASRREGPSQGLC